MYTVRSRESRVVWGGRVMVQVSGCILFRFGYMYAKSRAHRAWRSPQGTWQ